MEKLILDFYDLPSTGLMTEELFYLKADRPRISDLSGVPFPEPEADPQPRQPLPVRSFQTLGLYKKPLLFISAPESDTHTGQEKDLLENILKALNLSLDDIAFLEISSAAPVRLESLLDVYKPRLLLSFGAREVIEGWPENSILNEPLKVDQVMYLQGVSLHRLNKDKNEKLLLWTALKLLFKIK